VPDQPLTLSAATEGYLIAIHANGLSTNTIKEYSYYFRRLAEFFAARDAGQGDPDFATISVADLQAFLSSLTTMSQKTRCNVHIALSSMWHWAADFGLVERNIVRSIKMNKPEVRAVHPFTRDDVKSMINAVDRSKPYRRPGKRECTHSARMAHRNRALIYVLLDTGLRANELATLQIKNLDLKNTRLKVMGKGSKERIIPFSAQTARVIWRYLATRISPHPDEFVFVSAYGRELGNDDLRHIIADLGDRAGVGHAHPHRFRHTFAINFLRNGGNVYTLKEILGHASLKMCLRYLELAQADIEANYRPASPVRNWGL
jgi:integrase/recombinase XerD